MAASLVGRRYYLEPADAVKEALSAAYADGPPAGGICPLLTRLLADMTPLRPPWKPSELPADDPRRQRCRRIGMSLDAFDVDDIDEVDDEECISMCNTGMHAFLDQLRADARASGGDVRATMQARLGMPHAEVNAQLKEWRTAAYARCKAKHAAIRAAALDSNNTAPPTASDATSITGTGQN